MRDRMERALHQKAAIVEWLEVHTFWQIRSVEFHDSSLDIRQYRGRILSLAQEHDAFNRLISVVLAEYSRRHHRVQSDRSHVAYVYWRPADRFEKDCPNLYRVLESPAAANHKRHAAA